MKFGDKQFVLYANPDGLALVPFPEGLSEVPRLLVMGTTEKVEVLAALVLPVEEPSDDLLLIYENLTEW